MILFWSIAAAMTAAALLFLLPPLLRARRAPAAGARQSANAAIYQEQLDELAAELARGAITQAEFDRASAEVERRIVAEHGTEAASRATLDRRPAVIAAISIGLLLPLVAGIGYWQLGSLAMLEGGAGVEGAHAVTREQMESLVERLSARMEQTPDDPEGWMLLGRSLSVLGKYERSSQAYARAVKLVPNDSGLLTDYADSLAVARGRKLDGEPLAIVRRALEIDPENLKALALAGSAEFERRQYAEAIGYWERILKIAPPQSEFARSINESIAEARSLSGGTPAQKKGSASKPDIALQGTVILDPAVKARVSAGDTVFVLARPVSGSRMPLAVARTTVAALPYSFTLDDSMAMAPGAAISSHSKVVVAARVSKSGNAIPQKGDLEGTSGPVAPGARGLRVVISRIVD